MATPGIAAVAGSTRGRKAAIVVEKKPRKPRAPRPPATIPPGLEAHRLINEQEYALLRGCPDRTVQNERFQGTGCSFIKLGKSVRYKLSDVLAHLEAGRRTSTRSNGGAE